MRIANPFRNLRGCPACTTFTIICFAVYIVTRISWGIYPMGNGGGAVPLALYLVYSFGLHLPMLLHGAIWQPVTYIFLHGSLWHLLANVIMIVTFGTMVERLVGTRRFTWLFLVSGIIGGLGWMGCDILEPRFWMWVQTLPFDFARAMAQRWGESQSPGMTYGVCVGASASVCGLIGAFAAICPHVRLMVLLFYFIPMRMSARALALLLAFGSLAASIAYTGHVAHAAHLIGLLAGYIWARRGGRISGCFGAWDA